MFFKKTDSEITKQNEEVKTLKLRIKDLEREKRQLKEEVEDLKLKKKIEEEDIKHMVKIKEERLEIEHQKKVMEAERNKDAEVAQTKDEYRDKLETFLQKQVGDMKDMYNQILERLPNVNMEINRGRK